MFVRLSVCERNGACVRTCVRACVYWSLCVCACLVSVSFPFIASGGAPTSSCDSSAAHHGSPVNFPAKLKVKIISATIFAEASFVQSVLQCLEHVTKEGDVERETCFALGCFGGLIFALM